MDCYEFCNIFHKYKTESFCVAIVSLFYSIWLIVSLFTVYSLISIYFDCISCIFLLHVVNAGNMVKKEKRAKEQSKESLDEKKHINESPALLEENPGIPEPDPVTPADTIVSRQTAPQPTESSTQSKKRSSGAARGVCAMHKVVMKKAKGEKLNLRFNQVAVPVGDERHKLQSYIGMLARTMVPIDIPSWPKVDPELKEKIWNDLEVRQLQFVLSWFLFIEFVLSELVKFVLQDTFELIPESRKRILQSAGAKWRNFKAKLTAEYVLPYVGQKKKLQKPPKQYAFVGKKAWRRFVAVRVTKDWQVCFTCY